MARDVLFNEDNEKKISNYRFQFETNNILNEAEKNKIMSARANEIMQKARNEKTKMVYTGFLAQDVEAAAKKIGYDFSGVDAPKNNKDLYGLRYAEFVVPLVKAVQQQQTIIEKQQQQIDELVKELQLIKEKLK